MNDAMTKSESAQQEEVADILAKGVVRMLTTHTKASENNSPNLSHVGLSSSPNDRSL